MTNGSYAFPFRSLALLGMAIAVVVFALVMTIGPVQGRGAASVPGGPAVDPGDAEQRLLAATNGAAEISYHPATGVASFVRMHGALPYLAGGTSLEAEALAFFDEYGALFGIADPGSSLVFESTWTDAVGLKHLSYGQVYQGVEVFAGLIRVHFDAQGRISAVNGVFVPNLALSPVPLLTAAEANALAVDRVTGIGTGANPPSAVNSQLYVFRAGLTQGIEGPNHLAYEVEVSDGRGVREFVYVDAHKGTIIDQYSGIQDNLFRRVYTGTATNLVWTEGDPFPYVGPNPNETIGVNNLITATEDTYDMFFNAFGIDSYDNAGAEMRAVWNDPSISCPNANWNGSTINFCDGTTSDDVIGHEWAHAYTDFTSNLIYQWQSGALNESYSDVWGEVVDVINGEGTDTPNPVRQVDACTIYTRSALLTVNAPVNVAGDYAAGFAQFGPPIDGTLTGDVVLVDDGTGEPTDGCEPIVNGGQVDGNIAMIDRGTCTFALKVKNAQDVNATGVIIVNHEAGGNGTITMAGNDPTIVIQSLFIGYGDGNLLKAELGNGLNVTFNTTFGVTEDSYRWLMGEDAWAFGGAIRDMWNPVCYGDPGKVTDTGQYICTTTDNGGVHTNSGVPNHAFALLTDGGTYNGQTVTGIGMLKAAHIWWQTQAAYLAPASNFADMADGLEQSCQDLLGVNLTGFDGNPSGEVIGPADCTELADAILATELRTYPDFCNFEPLLDPDAPALCAQGGTPTSFFYEDWEAGAGSWITGTRELANPGAFGGTPWEIVTDLPDGRAGQSFFVANLVIGDCGVSSEAGILYLESPDITMPTGVFSPLLAFDHWVATEALWDGTNVKVSVNGGPWQVLAGSNFTFNAYNGALNVSDNPMGGEEAFTGTNGGEVGGSWGQSQVDLSGIAGPGDTIRLRFEMGQDGCNGAIGWYVDEVNAYVCAAPTDVSLTSFGEERAAAPATVLLLTLLVLLAGLGALLIRRGRQMAA
jgi:Zn-dependent metalloprotease